MAINALSYIGVNSKNLNDWSEYSQKYLGMQLVDRGNGALSFRMDDHKQRLAITGDTGDSLAFMGWEVEYKEDLEMYASRLEEKGIKITVGKPALADKRFVEEYNFWTNLKHFKHLHI